MEYDYNLESKDVSEIIFNIQKIKNTFSDKKYEELILKNNRRIKK